VHDAAGKNERSETEKERLDRNLLELLNELRVALPGVQVLFAFLLVLPFYTGFDSVTRFQEVVYFATLCLTALASILLIAPSARHRARFRAGDKHWVVVTGSHLTSAGLGCLGLAMTGAILLVTDVVFSRVTAIVASGTLLLVLGWLWFGAPLLRARNDP
jgi:hypothetical protein